MCKTLGYQKKIFVDMSGNKSEDGLKYDQDKLRMDLIPPEIIEELGKVFTYGANKYEDDNWKKVDTKRYIAALLRHYVSWSKGNTHDKESGYRHLSHMLTNIAFLLWKEIYDK